MWTALQALGGYIVGRRISGASDVYGVFAVVIGLLSWLYLGAQITMVSAEFNVVLRKGAWPRSLLPPPHRPEDERAMRFPAEEEAAAPHERVSVGSRDRPSHRWLRSPD